MLPYKEVLYVDEVPKNIRALLVGDIGGTNSNFGIFISANGALTLLFSVHFKSKQVTDFASLVSDLLTYLKKTYGITISHAGFAAAGVVSENHVKPTNLDFFIDAKEIQQKTGLNTLFMVNDFEVIGYGLDQINAKNLVLVNEGKTREHANKAILGAGTGLGKCIMDWNKYADRYIPLASEGGHADFAVQNQLELDLVAHIRKTETNKCNISWEDVLSGDGIQRIYHFFRHKNKAAKVASQLSQNGPHPDEIFNSRHEDEHCWNTFELYTRLYARCAKNFALDALAMGGVFIAGGIAAKNLPLFELDAFMEEFTNCGKQQELLHEIPIYVITDYNISLYGAARYMVLEGMIK
ncbi:MAG: glucokinase [bacterium]|nr:glucokinase [bacterium]